MNYAHDDYVVGHLVRFARDTTSKSMGTEARLVVRMEDLSDCASQVSLDRMMALVFSDRGPRSYPEGPLATSFLRLVDKAIIGHELARREFTAWNERRSFAALLRGQGHLETCVSSMHRALTFAERLRSRGLVTEDSQPLIPRARDLPVFSDDARQRIRRLRDAIEHVDAQIIAGECPVGQPIALEPRGAEMWLEDVRIGYGELAAWLRQLRALATTVTRWARTETEFAGSGICALTSFANHAMDPSG
ncbi:MAG: hypothetical protein ABR543_11860 [Gemmatimonadaceae bacterium]